MLKFDEDASSTKTKSNDVGIFLERKSILHYIDDDINIKSFNALENKLKKHFENQEDVGIETVPLKNNSALELIITINFNQEDDYYHLTNDFKANFEEIYKTFKK